MKNKNILITIIGIVIIFVGYFLYNYFQNKNYEKIEIDSVVDENIESTEEKINEEEKEEKKKIVVHITGEVTNNGVFELEEGSRVIDAVNAAGGLLENADLSNINLAYILEDEFKIYIPNKNEVNKAKEEKEGYIEKRNRR